MGRSVSQRHELIQIELSRREKWTSEYSYKSRVSMSISSRQAIHICLIHFTSCISRSRTNGALDALGSVSGSLTRLLPALYANAPLKPPSCGTSCPLSQCIYSPLSDKQAENSGNAIPRIHLKQARRPQMSVVGLLRDSGAIPVKVLQSLQAFHWLKCRGASSLATPSALGDGHSSFPHHPRPPPQFQRCWQPPCHQLWAGPASWSLQQLQWQ